ncbi:hypothetical protein QCN29_22755 [Streptomyces sp. HNM0663]|uniref:Uncharacterized protein n=1 Tax=Streptomyces chengmaiensis TaxID=3040919 RepID=A0ABT6HTC3_9ACTN|nr:hypothetical protein [Streptomyces chengmaiensis]MDH2391547.1 hypothetical protein [Streptomyces chengmaiensis]
MIPVRKRTIRGAVLGAVILSVAGIGSAQAEGNWSSYISDWRTGNESRRWHDGNTDSTSTSVRLGGCSASPASFKSVTLVVWEDQFGPDDNKGTRSNKCGTTYWGDLSSGEYYFSVELINNNATGFRFSASSVYVRY